MALQMNFAHLNVRSLMNQFDVFRELLIEQDVDIFAVSETWLDPCISTQTVSIPLYKFIRADREGRGGGVGFYIRQNIMCSMIHFEVNEHIEHLWISAKVGGRCSLFGVLYRPPRGNVLSALDQLDNFLSYTSVQYENIFIAGDLNINLLATDSVAVGHVCSFFESYQLTQIVDTVTRITPFTQTLLDIILVSKTDLVLSCTVMDSHGVSDHCVVMSKLKFVRSRVDPKFITYRDFKNFNNDDFVADLCTVDWDYIYRLSDIDEIVEYFSQNICLLYDRHAPIRTVRVNKKPAPWLTDTVKLMIRLRDDAHLKYRRTKLERDLIAYRNLRNYVTGAIRREKKAYMDFRLRNKNSKSLWNSLRSLGIVGMTSSITLPPNIGGLDAINRHFAHVSSPAASLEQLELLRKYDAVSPESHLEGFNFSTVSAEEVFRIIAALKSNAVGIDHISLNMLRLVSQHLLHHFTFIINTCILSSIFPSSWKYAKVLPMPKVANPDAPADFRPISVLPTMSKVLESVLRNQLADYVFGKNLIPDCQSGFRPMHSSTTAMIHITNNIFSAIDRGQCTCLLLLDYSRAFDTLNYDILCTKLKYYGATTGAAAMIRSFLNNRSQSVFWDGQSSQPVELRLGVPQGSLLGPLLFSIYVSDFWEYLNNCHIHQYADDTQIWYEFDTDKVQDAESIINADLQSLLNVSLAHGLNLNPSKSYAMLFGTKAKRQELKGRLNLRMGGTHVRFSESCKNLGLHLDENLRFSNHVSKLCQGSYLTLKQLFPSRHIMSPIIKLNICNSLIISRLSYCDAVYGPALLASDAVRLQRVQNSCVRFAFGIRKFERGISLKLFETKQLRLETLRLYHLLCLAHKIILTGVPGYISDEFRWLHRPCLSRESRHCRMLRIPHHSSACFRRSFIYCACHQYNGLDNEYRDMSLLNFKKRLKLKYLA